MDVCKVFVKPNMTTHRGCSSEMEPGPECTSMTVNCRECTENLCNGGIFPSTRLSCYHCQSSAYSNCNDGVTNDFDIIYPCETYNFRDSCYLYLDKDNVTTRGCLSDANIYTDLCLSNPAECEICNTSTCNNKSVVRPSKLSCIKCDSVTDPKCIWGFAETSATSCLRDLYFYEEESCYMLHVSDTTIIRGCTLDTNVCKYNPHCMKCTGNACNSRQKASLSCLECSSHDNAACFNDLPKIKNVPCHEPVTFDHRGCFTWTYENRSVARGCFSNLTTAGKFQCVNDHEHCDVCVEGDECNNILVNRCALLEIKYMSLVLISFLIVFQI